jgi:tRNA pseudouridine38-40 synthase
VRFRVTLAYDGTDFLGWQVQAGAIARTVQGVLESALAHLGGAPVRVAGAGRTDAGVHALGQVASFELAREISASDLLRALNGLLPEDVRVLDAATVEPGLHARKSAIGKLYRYELDSGPVRSPLHRRYAGWIPQLLQKEPVLEVAALFLGRHDFAALASSGGTTRTTVRTVTRSEVRFDDTTVVYEVEAEGFLRKMVRSMVGGLIAAGRGATTVVELRRSLESRDRQAWPAPADACGLTLVRVDYPVGGRTGLE